MFSKSVSFSPKLALAVGAVTCSGETAVLIEVSSSYLVPDEVDRLDFEVTGFESGGTLERTFDLSSSWPYSLAVYPGERDDEPLQITVTGRHGEQAVAEEQTESRFVPGETTRVWVLQHYSSTPETIDVRVLLHEGSNLIQVCYVDTTFGSTTYDLGASATLGIQGSATDALQYSCNSADAAAGLLLEYIHP